MPIKSPPPPKPDLPQTPNLPDSEKPQQEAWYTPPELRAMILSIQKDLARMDTLEHQGKTAASERDQSNDALKLLAQAALDLVVGFRIRAQGGQIQLGVLESMLRVNDLETAQAIERIVKTARELECQGLELLTPYDTSDDVPSGGIFAGPPNDEGYNVLEGNREGPIREVYEQGEKRRAGRKPRNGIF